GKMVSRSGWNGKNMFVYKTVGNTVPKDFIPKFASLHTGNFTVIFDLQAD
ncbi:MAG: DUF2829 domain-containing protein, partial [Bacteroidales bacterium]|nr:DUF2829 domain-containing protein [Bacteroidales bacterium]